MTVSLGSCNACFLCGLSWGQSSTSSLRGIVADQLGAVVVGAKVSLTNPGTGFSQSTTTDNLGAYQFLQIPPGTYMLTVSMAGFATIKQQNLVLQVNVPTTANVAMKVMAEASIIDVQSQAVQVNSGDATLGNAFGTQQIESLPFEGRDPTQILSLQPGVTFVGTNVDQNQDSRGGSVSGARSDQTNITLDGVDDNDQVKGYAFAGALRSTLDSLQEFRVTTSNANADEGRSSGAQVALITKGGTNSFHGSVYEYNRNNVGLANDWFNKQSQLQSGLPNVPGQLIRNTFGATFGGPIVKNRVFFFLAYEGQRTRENTADDARCAQRQFTPGNHELRLHGRSRLPRGWHRNVDAARPGHDGPELHWQWNLPSGTGRESGGDGIVSAVPPSQLLCRWGRA